MARVLIADRTHEVLEQRLCEAGFAVSVEPDHDYVIDENRDFAIINYVR